MAIADRKQMETLMPAHIRSQCVAVLVYFVRVARLMTTWSSEGKLRNRVEPLVPLPLLRFLSFTLLGSWILWCLIIVHLGWGHRLLLLVPVTQGVQCLLLERNLVLVRDALADCILTLTPVLVQILDAWDTLWHTVDRGRHWI